jgi:hypothetical protein
MTKPKTTPWPDILLAAVERSLEPYKRVLPAETIAWMREEALLQLAAHPYPAALLQALETRRATAESAVEPVDGEQPDFTPRAKSKTGAA